LLPHVLVCALMRLVCVNIGIHIITLLLQCIAPLVRSVAHVSARLLQASETGATYIEVMCGVLHCWMLQLALHLPRVAASCVSIPLGVAQLQLKATASKACCQRTLHFGANRQRIRLPQNAEECQQYDCCTLPTLATLATLAKALPDDCQLLPNCAGMICMMYSLQLAKW